MILVTGGAGFIGSNLVYALNQRSIDRIIIVDHLGTGDKWKNLRGLKFEDYLEKDDFEKYYLKGTKAIPELTTVFHIGACSNTTETNCSYLVENNYRFSKLLLDFSVSYNARLIYASSAATYGNGVICHSAKEYNGNILLEEDLKTKFTDNEIYIEKLKPLNMYGYSKHMFDLVLKRTDSFRKFKIVGLKYFNVFGANEYHKSHMKSFILKSYEQILQKGYATVFYQDGNIEKANDLYRDFIYIKDAINMTLYFYDNPRLFGLFNIGSGVATGWEYLTNLLIEVGKQYFQTLKISPKINYIPIPNELKDQYQYKTIADISSVRNVGYREQITPIKKAVANYLNEYLIPNKYITD